MTAPVEVRIRPERLTLLARLNRLADRVRTVADGGGVDAGFAAAVLAQLSPAVAEAEIQAAHADQAVMYLAEAGDRERARGALQDLCGELTHLANLLEGLDAGSLSKAWVLERLHAVVDRATPSPVTVSKENVDV